MGTTLSRNLRDLFEVAGCDGISPLDMSTRDESDVFTASKDPTGYQHTNPRPFTPVPHHRTRMLNLDPRSPTDGIHRTPIQVLATPESNQSSKSQVQHDIDGVHNNYLETDLDALDPINESAPSTPVLPSGLSLPPGLSASHLLKLKFLGLDPRSPSEGIVRTPIQVVATLEESSSEESNQWSVDKSITSLSRSLFGSSEESFNLSKACCEPSALLSDFDRTKDWDVPFGLDNQPDEVSVNEDVKDDSVNEIKDTLIYKSVSDDDASVKCVVSTNQLDIKPNKDQVTLVEAKILQTAGLNKAASGVIVFQDDTTRTPQNTPKKKSTRTPLTPICNLTPNDVRRAKKKQGKRVDPKKLVCKVLPANENSSSKQTSSVAKKGTRNIVDENTKLVEWDPDTSVVI